MLKSFLSPPCTKAPLVSADRDTNAVCPTCGIRCATCLFHHLSILQTSKSCCSVWGTLFCRLSISCRPRSNLLRDWILVVASQAVGAWLPSAPSVWQGIVLSEDFFIYFFLNRVPCCSPHEALAPLLHNEQ